MNLVNGYYEDYTYALKKGEGASHYVQYNILIDCEHHLVLMSNGHVVDYYNPSYYGSKISEHNIPLDKLKSSAVSKKLIKSIFTRDN
jgi:pectate lyase